MQRLVVEIKCKTPEDEVDVALDLAECIAERARDSSFESVYVKFEPVE